MKLINKDALVEQLEIAADAAHDEIAVSHGREQYYDGYEDGIDATIELIKEFREENTGENKKLVCKVCGNEFEPKKENRYVVEGRNAFFIKTMYDCYDCHVCGCQVVAKERMEPVNQ